MFKLNLRKWGNWISDWFWLADDRDSMGHETGAVERSRSMWVRMCPGISRIQWQRRCWRAWTWFKDCQRRNEYSCAQRCVGWMPKDFLYGWKLQTGRQACSHLLLVFFLPAISSQWQPVNLRCYVLQRILFTHWDPDSKNRFFFLFYASSLLCEYLARCPYFCDLLTHSV